MQRTVASWLLLLVACVASGTQAGEKAPENTGTETAAQRGYRFLTEKAYLPPDFDEATFNDVWREWPEPLRSAAEQATPEERRRMAFERYGLTTRPNDKTGRPLQYVVDGEGRWIMNCFACHGGQIEGQVTPGLPNQWYGLETLTEEIRATKVRQGKALSRMDLGAFVMPLGTSQGTTNAVMFGVGLMAYRDRDLNVVANRPPPRMVHHDMDAPPWWHFHKRSRIYIDGFAPKGHRLLMQFMLVRQNGPEKFREWEPDFRDVYAYLDSLRPPRYPYPIDRTLAASGERVFVDHCARCHGTYGDNSTYPEKIIPIAEIGTDRVRLDALTTDHRRGHEDSWFSHYGQLKVIADPGGYLAPPLDGVWASAPYFHNGSVPTLWHVLHPSERPVVWSRQGTAYDRQRVGLNIESHDEVPASATEKADRRRYFDTRLFGKGAAGHTFPDELDPAEKRAVLEYLKTL